MIKISKNNAGLWSLWLLAQRRGRGWTRGCDDANRAKYVQITGLNKQKKVIDDSNFRKLDKDFMDSLVVMRNRKLFSKISKTEVLIDDERINLFEELGEERLKEERRPAEMALKEINNKKSKRTSYFKSKKTFG